MHLFHLFSSSSSPANAFRVLYYTISTCLGAGCLRFTIHNGWHLYGSIEWRMYYKFGFACMRICILSDSVSTEICLVSNDRSKSLTFPKYVIASLYISHMYHLSFFLVFVSNDTWEKRDIFVRCCAWSPLFGRLENRNHRPKCNHECQPTFI